MKSAITVKTCIADKLGMDPTVLRDRNMVREGMVMPAYYGETANACALDRCMEHCKKMLTGMKSILFATWAMAKCVQQVLVWQCREAVFQT